MQTVVFCASYLKKVDIKRWKMILCHIGTGLYRRENNLNQRKQRKALSRKLKIYGCNESSYDGSVFFTTCFTSYQSRILKERFCKNYRLSAKAVSSKWRRSEQVLRRSALRATTWGWIENVVPYSRKIGILWVTIHPRYHALRLRTLKSLVQCSCSIFKGYERYKQTLRIRINRWAHMDVGGNEIKWGKKIIKRNLRSVNERKPNEHYTERSQIQNCCGHQIRGGAQCSRVFHRMFFERRRIYSTRLEHERNAPKSLASLRLLYTSFSCQSLFARKARLEELIQASQRRRPWRSIITVAH